MSAAGLALPGALLYSYAAGTLTPLATYTNQGGGSSNANPVVCDAAGQAAVWLGTSSYRMILKTAAGVTVWDVDNISSFATLTDFASTTDATLGDALVGVKQPYTGAVARTQHAKNTEFISAADFSTLSDALTASHTVSITSAYAVAADTTVAKGKKLIFGPAGSLVVASGKTVTINGEVDAPLRQIFSGSGSVVGIRQVYPEWWGAVADAATNDIVALEAAHTCVQSSLNSAGGKPTIYLSGQYAIGRQWMVTPTTDVPLSIIGRGQPTAARIVVLNSFTPAGAGLFVSGTTNASQFNTDLELRGFEVIASGSGYGACTDGILIGGTSLPVGQVVNLTGNHSSICEDVAVFNIPNGWHLKHCRLLKFSRCSTWNNGLAVANNGLLIDQAGGFTGDFTFEACQFVAPQNVASAYPLLISSDNATYTYTAANQVAGISFDDKCIFYYGAQCARLHAGSGSWLTDIWFNPACQFEGSSTTTHGVYAESTGTTDTRIENIHVDTCYLSTTTSKGVEFTTTGGLIQSVWVIGNWFDRQAGPAANFFASSAANFNGLEVSGNVISNSGSASAALFFNGPCNFVCFGNKQTRNNGAPAVTGATYAGYMISIQLGCTNFICASNVNGGYGGSGVLQDLSGAVTKTVTGNI